MSEPKLISPLLDGFSMGNPLGAHHGIQCCPAIKENTDKKYIVKIISIPASQVQMDALLLAGAYKDPADAMEYFKRTGEEIMQEASFLKKLSKLNGFLPYENWQMEPITRKRLGYQVYLLGSYKRSLEKHVKRSPVTHLEAINLGLDLCSALSVCREAGALYVALKPSNIFVSEKKEYRIGDLGFVQLDALSYTSLPEKYFSPYTPAELLDPMATLNLTVDTYAVGMILYQLYNDGQLPFKDVAPQEELPTPLNADYELAEIIMKAIHPDPAQRWDDPKDLGKALAQYMQKNSVNDVPITPYTPLDVAPEDVMLVRKESEPAPDQADTPASVDGTEDADTATVIETEVGNAPSLAEENSADEPQSESEQNEADDDGFAAAESSPEVISDETLPGDTAEDILLPHEMSEELSKIIDKADDLIDHTVPDGVVVPEAPELPDPFAFANDDPDEIDESNVPREPLMEEPVEETPRKKKRGGRFDSPERQRKVKRMVTSFIVLLILGVCLFCGFFYYQNFYLQQISQILVDADKHELKITVVTETDQSKLTVVCSDNYGNVTTSALNNGQATFTGLIPNTMYTIRLEIEGFHKLTGETTTRYTTDATTNIVSFHAVTGSENGSVLLNFTVDGDEPEVWNIDYFADGEDSKRETFSGHTLTLEDLSIGKVYTFVLSAGGDLSISGNTELTHMPSRLILAENLTASSTDGNDMTIRWKTPGDIVVESWEVRCYNDSGFEQQMNVTGTEVYFSDIDINAGYTIEVTADGMTLPAKLTIHKDPILIRNIHVNESDEASLQISWDHTGTAPDGGWLVTYSADGGNSKEILKCKKAEAVISPKVPGCKYEITIEAAGNSSVLNSTHSIICSEALPFEAHGLKAENITLSLLPTPDEPTWYPSKIQADVLTDDFRSGEKISVILHSNTDFYRPGYDVEIMYVIRDAYGNVLPELVATEDVYWTQLWDKTNFRYAGLNIPKTPKNPGTYTIQILFNGMSVGQTTFTIS